MRSWHLLSRFYSSQAKRPSRFAEGTVSLDHPQFLQRGRALALWRTIVRGCRNISDEGTREETLRFAREEFRRNKDVRDLVCLYADPVLDIDGEDAVGGHGEVYYWALN
ncbi:LYR motif-containing protein, partial [Lachnellula hyalina]